MSCDTDRFVELCRINSQYEVINNPLFPDLIKCIMSAAQEEVLRGGHCANCGKSIVPVEGIVRCTCGHIWILGRSS